MMGVCLNKYTVIEENVSVQGDIMPTSSTAKLRAANKQVNLPGKVARDVGKNATPARDAEVHVALSKRIRDKDSSHASETVTKEPCPDAAMGGDNEGMALALTPASAHSHGVDAVEEGNSEANSELPLMDMPADIAKDALSQDESKSEHSDANLNTLSEEENVMGNTASSKLKTGNNGSIDKVLKEDKKALTAALEAPQHVVASNVQAEGVAEELAMITEVVPSFKMPNIPDLTKPAPDFCGQAVVDGQFKELKLSDYKGKYLVLFFYPLDFTFVCPTEIISFSDRADDFRKVNCELIACSTDSQYSHFAWVNTSRKQGGLGALNIPLLADKTGQIAKDYGCFKEDEGIAFRGLYIIDDKGRLRQITINDLPVGRSVDETLRLVQAFQFTDKHGEVCPAGWKPGEKTMKPDPTGSKEYFKDAH